jgi:5,10-methylenetetrahydromethanopterin reductase
MEKIGISFTGVPLPVRNVVELVKYVEEKGFYSAWILEDYFLRDGISYLANLAYNTRKIKLATGLINPYTRNPALIALTIATLDELSNGRMILGLGAGVQPLVEQMGIPFRKPLKTVEEAVEIVRLLLKNGFKGEKTTYQGEIFKINDVDFGTCPYFAEFGRFKPIRDNIPIYVGAIGPKMIQLAGKIADGVLLSLGSAPQYVKHFVIKNLKIGAEKAGRSLDEIDIATYILCSVSKDRNDEHKAAKGFVTYAIAYTPVEILEVCGYSEDDVKPIREALETKGLKEAMKHVTEDMFKTFAIIGSPEECREKIIEYIEMGTKHPIILPIGNIKLAIESIISK